MIKLKNIFSTLALLIFFSCTNSGNKETEDQEAPVQQNETPAETGWEDIVPAVVNLESFDGERVLESGQGFFVAEDIIATRFSLVNQATNVMVTPVNSNEKYRITEYVALDRINDIILLKTNNLERVPVKLHEGNAPDGEKTIYLSVTPGNNIQLFTGKMFNRITVKGAKVYRISNRIRKSSHGGPVFIDSKEAIGIAFADIVSYETQSLVIPSSYITPLLENKADQPMTLESLSSGTNEQTAAENRKIKGLVLETDMGDITIRLFNETPEYRDNFIKLAKENYFDSLLFHRVIANFGIQSGAADTRYAEEGDIVGWKGPGYTMPAHIVTGLYHKRGMIGSPRKPDTQNQKRRSDGSQFYIVSGRRYFDKELDELEEENNHKFTPQQREVIKQLVVHHTSTEAILSLVKSYQVWMLLIKLLLLKQMINGVHCKTSD